jgi:hypothetical protein
MVYFNSFRRNLKWKTQLKRFEKVVNESEKKLTKCSKIQRQ